jgi:hypothetical protein
LRLKKGAASSRGGVDNSLEASTVERRLALSVKLDESLEGILASEVAD